MSWFDVPTTQMSIFILLEFTGVSLRVLFLVSIFKGNYKTLTNDFCWKKTITSAYSKISNSCPAEILRDVFRNNCLQNIFLSRSVNKFIVKNNFWSRKITKIWNIPRSIYFEKISAHGLEFEQAGRIFFQFFQALRAIFSNTTNLGVNFLY